MKLNAFSQNFGIYVVAFWSVVLGLLNFIRLLFTFKVAAPELLSDISLLQFYSYQWACLIFGLAFLAAAIGLGRRRNWGRFLFLAVALAFFITSIGGLFTSVSLHSISVPSSFFLGGRYLLSIVLPFIYLNLPSVKNKFTSAVKERNDYE